MGVYIQGMEMPNTCQICRAARLDRLIDCEEFDRLSIAQRMYKRSETCPIVPVPPHGRLIDADAFLALINDSTILSDFLKCIIKPLIRGEPTVIEAEEGET